MGLFCTVPTPLTTPFTAIFPKGPASRMAGGMFDSGPVKVGAERGAGAAGAAVGAGAWAGAGASCTKADVAINAAVRNVQRHFKRVYTLRPPEVLDYKAD